MRKKPKLQTETPKRTLGFPRHQSETPRKEVEQSEKEEDSAEAETIRLYVGNLSLNTTEESLREAFEEFGEVVSLKIERDKSGKSKGFAYVEMKADEAEEALTGLNGTELNSKKIEVKKTKPE
jgi:RNA recognition motif-containing protein